MIAAYILMAFRLLRRMGLNVKDFVLKTTHIGDDLSLNSEFPGAGGLRVGCNMGSNSMFQVIS